MKIGSYGWEEIDPDIILSQIEKHTHSVSALDATNFMQSLHGKRLRADGRLYSTHPVRVIQILVYFGVLDDLLLAAAALHDVFEEEGLELIALVSACFGEDVVRVVLSLTQLKGESQDSYMEKVLLSHRSVLIKIADRIHILRNMHKRLGQNNFFTKKRLYAKHKETINYILPMIKKAILLYPEWRWIIISMEGVLEQEMEDVWKTLERGGCKTE